MLNMQDVLEMVVDKRSAYELQVFSKAFSRNVLIKIDKYSGTLEEDVSVWVIETINAFLLLDVDSLEEMKNKIWENYEVSMRETSFMKVPDSIVEKYSGNEEMANREYFGISSISDAFNSVTVNEIFICDSKRHGQPVFTIFIGIPWDEHGISFLYVGNLLNSVD